MEMLQITVIATMCFVAQGQVTYKACLDKNGKYKAEAFDCDDKLPRTICERLYEVAGIERPGIGNQKDRFFACWTSDVFSKEVNKEILKRVLDTCPRTCALCCKTAKYDCEDDKRSVQKNIRLCDETINTTQSVDSEGTTIPAIDHTPEVL
ncbi:unnamed protein product [Cylicocyclus nassatus]|uniref:Uncharacterized protein n=1 Tax=Cylicocyclus nassatus TaxID=53992 RepID=A0AA36M966_CYLNA|nr:unnamed protein product [Cylicocyclus nassatus]